MDLEIRALLLRESGDRHDLARHQGKPRPLSAHESGKVQSEDRHLTVHHWTGHHTSDPLVFCNLSIFHSLS